MTHHRRYDDSWAEIMGHNMVGMHGGQVSSDQLVGVQEQLSPQIRKK